MRIRILTLAFLVSCFATGAFGQKHNGKHVHDNHPTSSHANIWKRTSLTGSGYSTPIIKLEASGWDVLFDEWLVNSTCNDDVERGNEYSRTVTHTVNVQLTGSYEWGAEVGAKVLAAELKATTKARVELSGGWQGEWAESLKFSSKFKLKKCQKIYYSFIKNRKAASGSVHTWEHKVVCTDDTGQEATNHCACRTIPGTSVGWGTHYGEHVQRGLVKDCPCSDIDPQTTLVFEPSVVVAVHDPSNQEVDGETDKAN